MQRDARHGFLRRMQDKLRIEAARTEAQRDALTGLFNRRRLEAVFARLAAQSSKLHAAVLMIDVDHFKQFNDQNGHLSGDVCLRRIADLLLGAIRKEHDLVVRFGGEEFLILLPGTKAADASRVADRIRTEIEALGILHADGTKPVTVSIGVAVGEISAGSPESLIAGADAALYSAKQAGRNRVWPPPLPAPAEGLAEGLEGDQREGVGNAFQDLQTLGDEMADVAVV